MTHPLLRKEIFVETAFERRFQAMLRSAWYKRSWHVIVADPGSGKTMGIRDLVKTAGSRAILAIVTPKNNEDEQALGDQLYTALGLPLRGHWRTRKPKLMGHLHQYGTECIIVDDAHDLSLEHLMFIKEITDQGRLQYDHPLGLCLVAAGRGQTIPLKETLDLPDPTWLQFRRRLDKLNPFCRIASHTSEEVREILAALETVYREVLPQLTLRQWSGAIYMWLTQPILDPARSGWVTMDHLMKLVTTALEWSYQAGDTDVRAETLQAAAELLVLRRDTLWLIEGAGPVLDFPQPHQSNGSVETSETEAEQDSSPNVEPGKPASTPPSPQEGQPRSHQDEPATRREAQPTESQQTKTAKCTFSGAVPIDLNRFVDSGIALVECPDCGRAWTLSPQSGVLRFKAHDKRKTQAQTTSRRWARIDSVWDMVGG